MVYFMVVISATGTYRFKIVLYGPSLSGKTVMLNTVQKTFFGKKSKLYSIEEPDGRTMYFDYLVIRPEKASKIAFDIYTVPGQKRHARQRRIVLNGADCIIFVADSDPQALPENVYSFNEMKNYLGGLLNKIPLLVAVNKRDLPDALPVRVIIRALKLDRIVPIFPTIAISGYGVKETFREAFRLTMLAKFFPSIYEKELERIKEEYKHLLPKELLKKALIKL
ncbi:MAG: gliding-motility protein MglA [Thermoprotei archaeon]|nr:MAG: gliding-motility protein MglA [Thermoprotei archaeon]